MIKGPGNRKIFKLMDRIGVPDFDDDSWPHDGVQPTAFFIRVPAWLRTASRHPENCQAPLDLGYCCTLASHAGFRPVILDLETGLISEEELLGVIEQERPEAIFIDGITPSVPVMHSIAAYSRRACPDSLIVALGQHADYSPETFLYPGSPFNFTTISEFELTVGDLLSAMASGRDKRVAGTASWENGQVINHGNRELISDLDCLEMPAHRLFLNRHYMYLHPMQTAVRRKWGFIQASRGCPFSCIYCSKTLRNSFGPQVRTRSPKNIVAEMKWLKKSGVTTIVFIDDLFNSSKEFVVTLCEEIIRAGLKIGWTAQGRVKPLDLEMCRLMKRAGCSTFSMGIESGSPAMLKVLGKKATVAETERAFEAAKDAGLLRVGFFMVGCPGETKYDFEMTRALLRRIKPEMIQVANFTCYPGSQAYETYLKSRNIAWDKFHHYDELINLSAEPDEVVRQWQKQLYLDLLMDTGFPLRYVIGQKLGILLNVDREFAFAMQAAKRLL